MYMSIKLFLKRYLVVAVIIASFFLGGTVFAAGTDGAIDTNFNYSGGAPLAGANNGVTCIQVLSSGKVMIAGNFTSYDGVTLGYIARLNSDGTVDTGWNYSGGAPLAGFVGGGVSGMTVLPNGDILAVGNFTSYDGVSLSGHMAYINADGTITNTAGSFVANIGTGANAVTRGVGINPNTGADAGKVVFGGGGAVTTWDGNAAHDIVRVNANGVYDNTFNTNVGSTGFNGVVYQIGFQSNGGNSGGNRDKVIAAGGSTTVEGHTIRGIARLNENGSYDTTWNPSGAGTNGTVYTMEVMPDDTVWIGGSFYTYNGVTTGNLIHLSADGVPLTGVTTPVWTPGTGAYGPSGSGVAGGEVDAVYAQPNGKLLIAGYRFVGYNGSTVGYIARINADGTLDTTFNNGAGTGFTTVPIYDAAGGGRDYYNSYGTIFLPSGNALVGIGSTGYAFNGVTTTGIGNFIALQTDSANPVISAVSIASNNTNTAYAKSGDTVTLSFTSNHPLTGSTATLGGSSVTPSCVAGTGVTVNCTATLTVTGGAPVADGVVAFSISVTTVGGTTVTPVTATNDSSSVTVLRATPATPSVSVTSPTNNTTPGITGSCTTGDGVTVAVAGQTLTTTCASSAYSVTPTAIADGSYTVSVTQTDAAGNVSTAATTPLVIDTVAPVVTISTPTNTQPIGASTISGTCESGYNVLVLGTGFTPNSGTILCVSGGYSYSITITGATTFSVSETDGAGNTTSATGNTTVPAGINPIWSLSVNVSTGSGATSGGSSGMITPPVSVNGVGGITFTKKQFLKNLVLRMSDPDVTELQRFLNSHNYVLVTTGAGSPGYETKIFGLATKKALIKYQQAKGIIPAIGNLGPVTRALINTEL
jgi:uncharacterized delta-60 repeat protein